MTDPYFYLREDERPLLRIRASPSFALVLLAPPFVALGILLALALLVRAFVPPVAEIVPAWAPWTAWGVLLALVALAAWRRAATSEYALTNERVYARVGRLVTRLHFTTHDKVTDIHYRQGPLERAFGLASVTFSTAGGAVVVAGIRDALGLKAAAEGARDAFVRALLADAGVRRADLAQAPAAARPESTSAPEAPAPELPRLEYVGPRPDYLQKGDTPVWSDKPRLVAGLGALRALLGVIPILLFSNLLEGPRRYLILVAALGFVAMSVAVRLMQLRRTEYVATDRRVYARRGLVGTTVSQLTYDKITDITYHQSVIGRLLGYGTVTVQSAGGAQAPIVMVGLANPLAAKETIERWRDASVGGAR